MISADPTIPHPHNPQSYNRYSYVMNNPSSRIDPTGFTDEQNQYLKDYLFTFGGTSDDLTPGFTDLARSGLLDSPPAFDELLTATLGSGFEGMDWGLYLFPKGQESERRAHALGNSRAWYHKIGEWVRGRGILNLIEENKISIDTAAASYDQDGDLIRAIFYEEQTHQLPGEGLLEHLGFGRTVGLGQITVKGQNKYTRKELLDLSFQMNIDATAIHLSYINADSIAMTASLYNDASRTSISDYGVRVDYYYYNFVNGIWP